MDTPGDHKKQLQTRLKKPCVPHHELQFYMTRLQQQRPPGQDVQSLRQRVNRKKRTDAQVYHSLMFICHVAVMTAMILSFFRDIPHLSTDAKKAVLGCLFTIAGLCILGISFRCGSIMVSSIGAIASFLLFTVSVIYLVLIIVSLSIRHPNAHVPALARLHHMKIGTLIGYLVLSILGMFGGFCSWVICLYWSEASVGLIQPSED